MFRKNIKKTIDHTLCQGRKQNQIETRTKRLTRVRKDSRKYAPHRRG